MSTFEDLLKQIAPQNNEQSETTLVDPIDYGNGVLYFDCIRDQFAKSLSAWIGVHKNDVVVAVAPNFNGGDSNIVDRLNLRGYIVVVYRTRR